MIRGLVSAHFPRSPSNERDRDEREVLAVPDELPGVMRKLEATRREFARYQFWLKLSRILLAEIVLGCSLVLADWMWVLPTTIRGLGLLAMVGLAVVMILRSRRPDRSRLGGSRRRVLFSRARSADSHRSRICRTRPRYRLRVSRPDRALGRDTDRRTSGLEFRKSVPWASFDRRRLHCSSPPRSES